MQAEVLVLDIAGLPVRWSSAEGVAGDYAGGKVACELGDLACSPCCMFVRSSPSAASRTTGMPQTQPCPSAATPCCSGVTA